MTDTIGSSSAGVVLLEASDGFTLEGFEVGAAGARRGGLVILQEIFGVTDQLRSVARRYAAEGFDVLVPALFDRHQPGTVIPFAERDRAIEAMLSLDKAKTMLDIEAGVRHLDRGAGVSAIGFCWGGGLAVRSACELELAGAVSFYGTSLPALLGGVARCPLLFHFGATDSHSPPEVIAAVADAFPDSVRYVYDAGHAFANDARPDVHHAAAAESAHARTLDFLLDLHPAG